MLAEWHLSPREVDQWTDEQFNLYVGSYIVRRREEIRVQEIARDEAGSGGSDGVSHDASGRRVETNSFNMWDVPAAPYPGARK